MADQVERKTTTVFHENVPASSTSMAQLVNTLSEYEPIVSNVIDGVHIPSVHHDILEEEGSENPPPAVQ